MSTTSRWNLREAAPRLPRLVGGLLVCGVGIGVMAEANLGLGPWEALHQGVARLTGLELGTVSILLGIPILAAWWPLGERPGIGTVLNLAIIGVATNVTLSILPTADVLAVQLPAMFLGVLAIGVGSALYLSTDLGPGPRDGLMTGLHLRFGWSIRRARTGIEVAVVLVGFLTGGTIGVGTVVFALGIGALVQAVLRVVDREGRVSRRRRALLEGDATVAE